MDASDFVISAVISEVIDEQPHPNACHTEQMDSTKIIYKIHNEDMIVVVSAFQEWTCYLQEANYSISVYTDHKNLEYGKITKIYELKTSSKNTSTDRLRE
jgi:hypothetical protein